jgi:hypothetical protein
MLEETRDTRLHSVPLTEGTPRSNSSNKENDSRKSIFYNIMSYVCCCLIKN